ncbi:hypothetical protein [Flavobacterium chilense]|uniref:Lipoprotein n=1 Tax=Flavobacterium chilense TaxID=946677 RepID=A0A1M7DSV2_9FLAO|nr:hypothetical protein [Flavobacterium chilense]SHL82458.1 hypothetical protein SAMN05444484_102705 [Flavobacterium chilense]
MIYKIAGRITITFLFCMLFIACTPKEKINFEIAPVNFLDKKYQENGFVLPDTSKTVRTYPSYLSSDDLGVFSVNYIGKTGSDQFFWEADYMFGFFSNENKAAIENPKVLDQKVKEVLKKHLNKYYIIAEYFPKEEMAEYNSPEDFKMKDNALIYFYLYDNNKWIFIKKIASNKIDKKGITLYNDLLLEYKLKDAKPIPKEFQGKFSVNVETEITSTGMANITYHFSILKDKVMLEMESFHEPVTCMGTYKALQHENVLDLFYVENDDIRCKEINHAFSIKKENDKYYIKGAGSLATSEDWVELNKS